jgi:hypothetical protein
MKDEGGQENGSRAERRVAVWRVLLIVVVCALSGILLFIQRNRDPAIPAPPPPVSMPQPGESPARITPLETMKPLERPRIRRRTLDVPPSEIIPQPAVPLPPSDSVRRSATVVFPDAKGDRVAAARVRAGGMVRDLFASAGVAYPAEVVFLRAHKHERELELWAGNSTGPLELVATYGVAAASGGAGPKRREGDSQVPEGFYEVDRFNPQSSFHLSLGINYPNAADRILGDPAKPGYDIFVHGNAASIGCLAMGDDLIEEIYLAALDAKSKPVHMHIFPARMNTPGWPAWRDEKLATRPELAPLWQQLQRGYDAFEGGRRPPDVGVGPNGEYFVRSQR